MTRHEQKVSRAAKRAAAARLELDEAIWDAREAGLSLRAIAACANLSPEWVRRIASSMPPR